MSTEAAPPPKLWREELRRAWHELRGSSDTSAMRAATAVALGLFIGSQPILGFHTPLVITICMLLQLDAVLAFVASNISNPFFLPFLWAAELLVGSYLHTGRALPFDPHAAKEIGFGEGALYLFSGAPVVGGALALVGFVLVLVWVPIKRRFWPPRDRTPYRLPDNAPAWWHAVERVAKRYAPVPEVSTPRQRSRFHYVRSKMLTDPVSKMLAGLFGEEEGVLGEVLDIGTGRGQLAIVLLELGRARSVRGFDWDKEKVAAASEAAAVEPPLAATFAVGDVTVTDFEQADTVMLIDVVHYLTIAQQDEVLRRAAAAVRPGGHLVVREADSERGWRSWMTLAEEKLFTTLRFNRGARVKFRPAREIVAQMEAAGLSCEVTPAWGGTPFSNVLIVGRRAAEE